MARRGRRPHQGLPDAQGGRTGGRRVVPHPPYSCTHVRGVWTRPALLLAVYERPPSQASRDRRQVVPRRPQGRWVQARHFPHGGPCEHPAPGRHPLAQRRRSRSSVAARRRADPGQAVHGSTGEVHPHRGDETKGRVVRVRRVGNRPESLPAVVRRADHQVLPHPALRGRGARQRRRTPLARDARTGETYSGRRSAGSHLEPRPPRVRRGCHAGEARCVDFRPDHL